MTLWTPRIKAVHSHWQTYYSKYKLLSDVIIRRFNDQTAKGSNIQKAKRCRGVRTRRSHKYPQLVTISEKCMTQCLLVQLRSWSDIELGRSNITIQILIKHVLRNGRNWLCEKQLEKHAFASKKLILKFVMKVKRDFVNTSIFIRINHSNSFMQGNIYKYSTKMKIDDLVLSRITTVDLRRAGKRKKKKETRTSVRKPFLRSLFLVLTNNFSSVWFSHSNQQPSEKLILQKIPI